jgi:hypothetical protein
MLDERVTVIFEFDGIRIRVDMLKRLDHRTWGLA